MFKHIFLPLDGSQLAESAVPVAVDLCRRLQAQVILLHVIEKDAPAEIHGQRHLTTESDAADYLAGVIRDHFSDLPGVSYHVHTDEVAHLAEGIVQHQAEFAPDLIILSAHGEGGWRDLVAGSIAQQVIANGQVPVLLLQPDETGNSRYEGFSSFLVPLDGDPEHEQVLQAAIELASKLDAAIHLVRVVPTLGTLSGHQAAAGTLLPTTTSAYLDIAEDEACEYLGEMIGKVRQENLTVTAEVRRGDPAQEVVQSADENASRLILLGTHGKAGMKAFWSASTAPRIVSKTRIPILLIPVRSK